MSGRSDSGGQLALMDAMVFFVGAIAVSALLVSFVQTSPRSEDSSPIGIDVDEALGVILRSSLGSDIAVQADGEKVVLSRNDAVVDCLLLEAHAIARGDSPLGFAELNSRMMAVATAVFGPFVEPSLRLVEISGSTPLVLVTIPHEWEEVQLAYAAGAEISDGQGGEFVVQLRSVPVSSM